MMARKISGGEMLEPSAKAQLALLAIEGIGPYYMSRLWDAGVRSVDALRRMEVIEVSRQSGIPLKVLGKWQAAAILMQIPGVDEQVAEVWTAAGVRDIRTVALSDSMRLYNIIEAARNPRTARNKIPDSYERIITPYQVSEWKHAAFEIYFSYQPGVRGIVTPTPATEWFPAHESNYGPNPNRHDVQYIVLHAMDGYLQGTIDTFQKDRTNFTAAQLEDDPKRSAHYLIGTAGRVVQMVREADIAFHAKTDPPTNCLGESGSDCSGRRSDSKAWSSQPCNCHSIGIELEDQGNYVSGPDWVTSYLKDAAVQLVRSICDRYQIPKTTSRIIRHEDIPDRTEGKSDPGRFWNHAEFVNLVGPPPPPPPKKRQFHVS